MEQYEIDHLKVVRELAPECMVLLKSDGSFPLDAPGQLALFGEGAVYTLKGGTGSGDVYTRKYPSIEEALKKAGFRITSEAWLRAYEETREGAVKAFNERIKAELEADGMVAFSRGVLNEVMPKPVYDFPLEGEGDTAVYVLARVSGEGKDRTPEKGDLLLTDEEVRDILRLQKKYPRFLLVLNTGGIVDLSPVLAEVKNILLLSQTGLVVSEAFADVLLGKSFPSGKITDTWARWEDYCPEAEFGEEDDTHYREGIYVGYRYFDAARKTPLFPFGYGLSYTEFDMIPGTVRAEESRIFLTATVKNTGDREGKEVLELYVSKPGEKRPEPRQELAAFKKTRCLQPGEEEELTLSFDMRDLGSFDERTHSDILERGSYVLFLGNSSRNADPIGVIELTDDVTVRVLHDACGSPDFIDWQPVKKNRTVPEGLPVITLKASDFKTYTVNTPVPSDNALGLASKMRDEDLALFCTGAYNGAVGSNSVIGNAGITVAGSAGETIGVFKEAGIPSLIMADGPAGLRLSTTFGVDEKGVYSIENRLFDDIVAKMPEAMARSFGFIADLSDRSGPVYERYLTAIPIGTALAQSWNPEVWETAGDLVGEEMQLMGINLWLAPAMNIHRLPLCGRNFEYYSEDPLLSGKAAAGLIRGVQRHKGAGVVIKHFAANNQETNRTHSNTVVSQRALRDIYLRGFEIAIRESDPAMVMSSYNLLNGIHTSESRDLLEIILRQEWGFRGSVMSDWVCDEADIPHKYRGASASASIAAGNDIMMPGQKKFYDDILTARRDCGAEHPIAREVLETAAARMIDTAFRLGKAE